MIEQISSAVRSKSPDLYDRFCNTVRIIAEHIEEI